MSNLTDDEFLNHLLRKENPTPEDVEAALRIEMLMEHYAALVETVHRYGEAEGDRGGLSQAVLTGAIARSSAQCTDLIQ